MTDWDLSALAAAGGDRAPFDEAQERAALAWVAHNRARSGCPTGIVPFPADAPGEGPDPTRGATRFHRHDETPDWSRRSIPVALIGHYLFYVA